MMLMQKQQAGLGSRAIARRAPAAPLRAISNSSSDAPSVGPAKQLASAVAGLALGLTMAAGAPFIPAADAAPRGPPSVITESENRCTMETLKIFADTRAVFSQVGTCKHGALAALETKHGAWEASQAACASGIQLGTSHAGATEQLLQEATSKHSHGL